MARGTNRLALRRAAAQPAQAVFDGRRGPVSAPPRIDALDQGIIEALQANGRESFRAIAARLGVSEATIRARYARLCDDDILQVVGVTNPLGLGFEQALIGIKTVRYNHKHPHNAIDRIFLPRLPAVTPVAGGVRIMWTFRPKFLELPPVN